MPFELTQTQQGEIATHWDVGTIALGNNGQGASNAVIKLSALFGKPTTTPDPDLPVELGVFLFESFAQKEILSITFGALRIALIQAVMAGKVDQARAELFFNNSVGHFLQGIAIAKECLDLCELAKAELTGNGINVDWPVEQITKK